MSRDVMFPHLLYPHLKNFSGYPFVDYTMSPSGRKRLRRHSHSIGDTSGVIITSDPNPLTPPATVDDNCAASSLHTPSYYLRVYNILSYIFLGK